MSLTNSQHDSIMRIYHSIQLKNKHLLDQRFEEVYSLCPQLKEVEDRIISISMNYAAKIIQSNADSSDQYRLELNNLIQRRKQLLKEAGFSSDYLNDIYTCPLCHDTGYIQGKQCSCFKQKIIDMFYRQSNLKNIMHEENFKNFSLDWYSRELIDPATGLTAFDNMQKIMNICQNFIKSFDSSFQNLLFYGDTGVGKTFLSNCIACELLNTSHSVIYLTSIELFDIFAEHDFSYHKYDEQKDPMNEYIIDCDFLIIDDLGTELSNSFTNSKLFYCINERILNQKSTLISTNLSIRDLASNYSERIFSRISSAYTMLKLYGNDIRVQKRNKKFAKKS